MQVRSDVDIGTQMLQLSVTVQDGIGLIIRQHVN